jgi:predicted ribosome quality control (RQC) complex YloA/Tae2 family protein
MRRVDTDMSATRQVLPGLYYELPASVGRLPVTEETELGIREKLAQANPERQADAFLLDHYFGVSPLIARELVFRATGETDTRIFELTQEEETSLCEEILSFSKSVTENNFTPVALKKEGKPVEFSCVSIKQYGGIMETEQYESFSVLLDSFYEIKERQERARQRGADLLRTATTARDRLRRKLAMQEKDYAATQDRDQFRICGDLITSNFYCMERGQTKLVCDNYYDENCAKITISLDPLLTPQQNAAKYYKRYTKAKTAEKYLKEQMEVAKRDLELRTKFYGPLRGDSVTKIY